MGFTKTSFAVVKIHEHALGEETFVRVRSQTLRSGFEMPVLNHGLTEFGAIHSAPLSEKNRLLFLVIT